jgi:predicted phage baseplate assembly protein
VPTGNENVRAEYRKGIGLEGLVRADQLTLLLSRPLGAKGVTNPLPAVDAADPEPRDEARKNAPLQVLTLGRAVSLRDFEDFARGFAGVAKSLATRISGREKPGVFVTVAGANGAAFTRTADLATALRTFGDPFVPIEVKTFHSVPFRIEATVKIDPDRVPAVVQKAIEAALRERYSFESQAFGQPVFLSEAIAVIQSVEGVVSATVKLLDPNGVSKTAIPAVVPFGDVVETTNGADLLTLDPRPVTLTVTT